MLYLLKNQASLHWNFKSLMLDGFLWSHYWNDHYKNYLRKLFQHSNCLSLRRMKEKNAFNFENWKDFFPQIFITDWDDWSQHSGSLKKSVLWSYIHYPQYSDNVFPIMSPITETLRGDPEVYFLEFLAFHR